VTYRSYERNRDLDSEFDLWLTVANMQLQLKDNFDDFSVITVYVKCGTIEDLEEFGMYLMHAVPDMSEARATLRGKNEYASMHLGNDDGVTLSIVRKPKQ
jgi:hypothetical protein